MPATNPYTNYQSVAFIGMKADSMDDNVDTFACDTAAIPFGVVISRAAAASLKTVKGGALPVGISLHDHTVGVKGSYTQFDAVSVLNRGRVWAKCSAATGVADGAAVAYDLTTGEVNNGGTTALKNAVFRSAAIAVPDIAQLSYSGAQATVLGAIVELHYGLA